MTQGRNNTLIGAGAGDAITDGDGNTAVGLDALGANTLGTNNTAVGVNALLTLNITSGDSLNTAVGLDAGRRMNSGIRNVCIGANSGDFITSGRDNLTIGHESGSYQTTLTTGDGNVFVGPYVDPTNGAADSAHGFGYNLDCQGGYTTLGNGPADIRAAHGNITWATVSDERYKKDIVDSTAGLSFINALQPRTFKYKNLGELPEAFNAYEADSTDVFKNSDTNHGFIAQEVKAAIDADSSIKDGFRLWGEREDGGQEVGEAALIPVLTKAVQELSTALDAALARIATLEG